MKELGLVHLFKKNTEVQLSPTHQIFICHEVVYVYQSSKTKTLKSYKEV